VNIAAIRRRRQLRKRGETTALFELRDLHQGDGQRGSS
jgi:hypothetical protein